MWWIALIAAVIASLFAGVWLVHYHLAASKGSSSKSREGYADRYSSSSNSNSELMLYATTLESASYPEDGGRVWNNIAVGDEDVEGRAKCGSGRRNRLLHLSEAPLSPASFDRLDGFSMRRNVVTGPLCSDLGVQLDRAFSVALVFKAETSKRPARIDVDYPPVTLLRMFANTSSNNGLRIELDPATGALRVAVGSNAPMKSSSVMTMVHGKHYALIFVREANANVSILFADLSEARSEASYETLLRGRAPVEPSETLSNREMVVNESANWRSGRLLEVRVYSRAVNYEDIAGIRSLVQTRLQERSPSHRHIRDLQDQINAARKCPYDAKTCAACSGISDWMGVGAMDVAVTGSASCVAAIAEFCGRHPEHPRCSCWSPSNPEYHRKCRAVRAAFGDKDAMPICRPQQPPAPKPAPAPAPAPIKPRPNPHSSKCYAKVRDSDSDSDSDSDGDDLDYDSDTSSSSCDDE
jgi:hypothetical protein